MVSKLFCTISYNTSLFLPLNVPLIFVLIDNWNLQSIKGKAVSKKEFIFISGQINVGNDPPTEQYIVNTPGILPTGYGWKGTYNMSHGGIIFRENASGIIHIRNKVSLVSGEIIMDTMNFE